MADAKQYLDGFEISDEIKNQIIEKLNPVLTDFETKLADADGVKKEIVESRDKAKKELKELRDKFASGDFDGKREMEQLIKAKTDEVETLTKLKTQLEQDLSSTKTELETIQTETKAELKERFTEDEWAKVKDWDTTKIRTAAGFKTKTEANVDRSRRLNTYAGKTNNPPKNFSEWKALNADKLN